MPSWKEIPFLAPFLLKIVITIKTKFKKRKTKMKARKTKKKLELNKITIALLDKEEINKIKAGNLPDSYPKKPCTYPTEPGE
jgi:hypothetical protein